MIDEFQDIPNVKHRLVYHHEGDPRETMLDRKLIRQVISNLVSNAIKYSPDDKPITINLGYKPETVVLTVRDEGIGIPEADLKHLFEPFHRASNVGMISGTGLGLVITKESVDLHGGDIEVDSQVGIGTTMIVSIPTTIKEENDDDEDTGD